MEVDSIAKRDKDPDCFPSERPERREQNSWAVALATFHEREEGYC